MITNKNNLISWSHDDNGVAIFFRSGKAYDKATQGKGSATEIDAYARFEQLLEIGDASIEESQGGIYLPSDDVVRLDHTSRECFDLPPPWPGYLLLESYSVPNLNDFSAKLRLVDFAGT